MSLSEKTEKWLKENCGVSLKGKTVVVTGANSGVGFKTAETAVCLGADVILACRNEKKADAARDELLIDRPDASVKVMKLDMASFASIDAFVDGLEESGTDVWAFVNNAGAFHHPGEKTEDGFDLVIGTNYIGVYYLTEKLMPYLTALSHEVLYVNTVSVVTKIAGKVDYDDFFMTKNPRSLAVYARSKVCLARYTYALAERMKGSNIRVEMNHPGVAVTPLGLNALGAWATRISGAARPFFNSPEKSSLSFAYLVSHDVKPGSLVGPHIAFDCYGYPKLNRLPRKVKTGADELIRFTEKEIEAFKPTKQAKKELGINE
ncbi:MAG: SDR family NAD(P)-dependent oxidoreductase [Clostridia bacterium]|nr:SDR family NAD(P)-dependent oxidoreductase [Clostridia bacterium]